MAKIKEYVIGFLVFSLFILVMLSSAGYIYSDKGLNITVNPDDEDMINDFISLSNDTHNTFYDTYQSTERLSPGGNESGDNSVQFAGEANAVSAWRVLWAIPASFDQVPQITGKISLYFAEYLPPQILAIFVVSILIGIILILLSAMLRNRIE